MGLDAFQTKTIASVRINSDIADQLMEFEIENTNVSVKKSDVKNMLKNARTKDEINAFKNILDLFKDDDVIDLTIS